MEKRERGEHRGETNHGRNRRETGDGRRWERKKKTESRKGGMRQAREWERWDRKEKESGERQERRRENRVGGNKIIAAWLRRCGIK